MLLQQTVPAKDIAELAFSTAMDQGKPGQLAIYILFSYLLNFYVCTSYLGHVDLVDLRSMVFVMAVMLTYPLVYLLPIILFYQVLKSYQPRLLDTTMVRLIIVVLSTCVTLLLYGDSRLYELFAFHINGFAINILTTPGGLESLGGSAETYLTFVAITVAICIFHLPGFWLAGKLDLRVAAFLGNHKPLNLVWLVAESWRWDMLKQEIMPNTWKCAQQSRNYLNHYSGVNGTRQGLFALFYGIYGSYWDAFLLEEKGPVFLDVLKQQGYQMSMYTSASFTYPEFDKTIFAQVPSAQLHQIDGDARVIDKDRENVTRLLDFIDKRQASLPFFTFMFFESTHARYYFPETEAIRAPYLGDVNCATLSRESLRKDVDQLKNRYINASHYIDTQFNRIIRYLEEHDLLDNTIVLICGDHGEEFMEKGHWGHNAGFSEEQVKTPMVIYIPGMSPGMQTGLSSHMDVIPSLLPRLGVDSPARDYSLGQNLLADGTKNSYAIISDWAGLAYVDSDNKFTMPFKSALSGNNLSTRDDQPVASSEEFLKLRHEELMQVLTNSRQSLKH